LTHFISTYYAYIRFISTLIVSTCITFTSNTYNYPYITQINKQMSTQIIQIIKSILNPCVLYPHLPPTFQNLIPPSIHIHINSIINLLINYTTIATSTHILLFITAKLGSYITGKTSVSDPGPPLSISKKMRLGSWSVGVPYNYAGWSYVPSGVSHEHTVKGMEGRLKELGVEQEGLITGEVRGRGGRGGREKLRIAPTWRTDASEPRNDVTNSSNPFPHETKNTHQQSAGRSCWSRTSLPPSTSSHRSSFSRTLGDSSSLPCTSPYVAALAYGGDYEKGVMGGFNPMVNVNSKDKVRKWGRGRDMRRGFNKQLTVQLQNKIKHTLPQTHPPPPTPPPPPPPTLPLP
jgi:hypothetical protein